MKPFLRKLLGPLYPLLARAWNWLTAPHASVTEVGARRQARFLAALALLMLVLVLLQIAVAETTGRMSLALTLAILLMGTVFTYGFSRSPFPYWGSVILVYGFTLFAFALCGRAEPDVPTIMYGMIPIAYLLSGVLLSIGWQVALVVLVLAGSIGLGAWQPVFAAKANLVAGNLMALGVVLIVTSLLRNGIERRRLDQVRQINRELGATRDALAREQTLLRSSEARTRALLTAIPDMIFELSRDGVLLDFVPTQTIEPLFPPEQFMGRNIAEVMPPEIAAASRRAVQQALVSGQVQTFEYQLQAGDVLRTFEARVAASRPDAALAIVRDITERKRLEHETEERRLFLESVLAAAPDAIVTSDAQHIISEWNPGAARLFGYSSDEAIGQRIDTLITGADAQISDEAADWTRRVHSLKSIPPTETIRYRKDGSPVNVIVSAAPILARNEGVGAVAIYTDITERKQAEEKLQQRLNELATVNTVSQVAASQLELNVLIELTGERLRQIPNVHSLFIALCDAQSSVISFPYYRLYGVVVASASMLLGQGLTSLVIKSRKPLVIDRDYEQRSAELGVVREHFPGQPDRRPKTWMGIPMQVGGQIIGVICAQNFEREQAFTQDDVRLWETIAANVGIAIQNAQLYAAARQELAERKQLIAELEAKNAELERFTYTVSHDLKSPLVTIRGFLGFLEKDAASGDLARLRADVARITAATDKMQRLLTELLELSRIGRLINPPQTVLFEAIAREALELVRGRIQEHGVVVQVAPDLPAVYGDRLRLVEVAQNLLDNAAKFMGEQPRPRIEIGQRGVDVDGKPILFVRDNGIGIDPQHHERVFGLFNKLDAQSDGTGVGLALVKRIVQVHGGRIWVESELGQGATFYFTLASPHAPEVKGEGRGA